MVSGGGREGQGGQWKHDGATRVLVLAGVGVFTTQSGLVSTSIVLVMSGGPLSSEKDDLRRLVGSSCESLNASRRALVLDPCGVVAPMGSAKASPLSLHRVY